ncbi:hypothetical protein Pelo_18238 [Pelomyxa schiedti]|nr:hypothetical protein Pelo_18238 [Pelomyxa schiedti]
MPQTWTNVITHLMQNTEATVSITMLKSSLLIYPTKPKGSYIVSVEFFHIVQIYDDDSLDSTGVIIKHQPGSNWPTLQPDYSQNLWIKETRQGNKENGCEPYPAMQLALCRKGFQRGAICLRSNIGSKRDPGEDWGTAEIQRFTAIAATTPAAH